MADHTTPTNGEQPSSPNELSAESYTPLDAAHMPSVDTDLSHTSTAEETSPTEATSPIFIKPDATLDEIIASLPDEIMAGLNRRDLEALAAGDPDTVARILNPSEQDPALTSEEEEETSAPQNSNPPATDSQKAIERISLRGLTVQDQHAIADAIAAVREGRFSTFDEARSAMAPASSAADSDHSIHYPADPEVEAAEGIVQIQQRIAEIEAEQQEAATTHNTQALYELNTEMVSAKLALRDAQAAQESNQVYQQDFAAFEADSFAAVQLHYAEELAHPVILEALNDARDLAEHRDDPILQSPDWPEQLIARVLSRFHFNSTVAPASTTESPPAFPTPPVSSRPVRGALEAPGWQGTSSMSVKAALSELDHMTEEQIDAVLKGVQMRHRAEHLRR